MNIQITEENVIIKKSEFIDELDFSEEEIKASGLSQFIDNYFLKKENRIRTYCAIVLSKKIAEYEKLLESKERLESVLLEKFQDLSPDEILRYYTLISKEIHAINNDVTQLLPKITEGK